jgi:hypothetical protein
VKSPTHFYEEILTGPFVDLGIFNMGKIANVSDNLPQKLTLAIKSGKYKIGKLITVSKIFRLQARSKAT